jgi:O-antigen/teichoic acid export membrane protein
MSLAQSAASGAKWSVVSVAGRRLVTFLTSVVLARLLSPADFGLVAMAAVFVGFLELLRDMGTGTAIVQADRPTDALLSSIFWLNLGFGVVTIALLLSFAPLAAILLRQPQLSAVLRILSISIFFAAVSVVSTSILIRELRFRRLAIVELVGSSVGGMVGIGLALSGYAVWSLVWQSLCTAFIISAGTCLSSSWRPRILFDLYSVKSVVGFSANLTGFNVMNYFVRNVDNFLIGRYLGAANLGFYDVAYRVMLSPLQLVSWALGRALFPVYARMRADQERLGAAYLKVTGAIALVAFPMMFGLVGVADPLVVTVLGPTWAPVVPLLLILAPLGALQAIGTNVGYIYQAMGRTDLLLRWGAGTGMILVPAFVIGLQWGIVGVAACYAVVSYALAYHLFKIPLSLIGVPVFALVKTVARSLFCSAGMLVVLFCLQLVLPKSLSGSISLSILVAAGVVVYACATWFYNWESTAELVKLATRA